METEVLRGIRAGTLGLAPLTGDNTWGEGKRWLPSLFRELLQPHPPGSLHLLFTVQADC